MFLLTDQPIDPARAATALRDTACGAYVAFEGWVRDENEGQRVVGLHYEAYPELALAEGNALLKEILAAHDCRAAHCIHRVGTLALGDIAVWVGVVAPHRAAAFSACTAIMDALKQRVPIWKREHYADANETWLHPKPSLDKATRE
jgi:molybdopterin synthase catalytic subunit